MRIMRVGRPARSGRRWRAVFIAALAACASLAGPAATPAMAQERTYNQPLYRDTRLDWCLVWANQCGQPAADAFCQRHRFLRARTFRADPATPKSVTRTIGTNQVCNSGGHCTPFASITCADRVPSRQVFANPAWGNKRLDVCLTWGRDCGKPAADAFCRKKGFSSSLHAEPDAAPGYAQTRVLSTNQVCTGSFCTGFQQIICQ